MEKTIKIIKFQSKENTKNKYFNNIKTFNYGLAVLKCLLAFSVVSMHNFKNNSTKNTIILYITKDTYIHVPSFFIISFYLMSINFSFSNKNNFLRRIKRLLIPYIFWPIIIWIMNRLFNIINKKIIFPESYSSLILQLLWGHEFMFQFWFQWNLLVITILFYLIIKVFKKQSLFFLLILLILAYISQYSGFNYIYFYIKFPPSNRLTIGRLFEMIPFAVTGYIFGFYRIVNFLEKKKIKVQILSIIIYNIIKDLKSVSHIKGLGYKGINLNIQSECVFCIFSLLHLEIINEYYIYKLIIPLINHSAGVFYLHISIKEYFKFYIDDIKNGTFFGIILNYIICIGICKFGIFFFSNSSIKYLFC